MPAAHPDEFGPHTRDDALADNDRYPSVEHAEGENTVAPVPGELRRRLLRRKVEVGEVTRGQTNPDPEAAGLGVPTLASSHLCS